MSYIKADNKREQVYFDFLEDLRQSGDTNMFGASPYLVAAFQLGRDEAREVLGKWMKLHDDPSRLLHKPLTPNKKSCKFVTQAEIEEEAR